MTPAVSVLLPVRNARATLDACLRSLAIQTLSDHEVVVVDDASADGSGECLERAARADRRLHLVRNRGRGLVAALNAGLAAARAPLVARMDADDVCRPDRLEVQARWLDRHPEVAILGSRVRLLSADPLGNRGMQTYVAWLNRLLRHEDIVRDLWIESPLAHPSVMMRTASLRALSGYREFDGPEDYDLWLRAHERGFRFGKSPEVLLDWRDGESRLTRTDPRYGPGRFRDLKIETLARGPLRGDRAVVLWGAGPIAKGWAKALRARALNIAAFVDVHPRRVGVIIQGAKVVDVAGAAHFPGALHLAAVGQAGARDRIRSAARDLGLREGHDFLAVA